MSFCFGLRGLRELRCVAPLCTVFFLLSATLLHAGVIRGTVTDTSGATVTGATVVLMNGNKYVGKTVSTADGSYQLVTGQSGRFSLIITAQSFRQLEPPSFYAGAGASVEQNLVMEPEWVHQSIVVTATGTPTPQQQTSEATSVLGNLDLVLRDNFVDALRLMPGTVTAQVGQLGAQASLFVAWRSVGCQQSHPRWCECGRSRRPFRFRSNVNHRH